MSSEERKIPKIVLKFGLNHGNKNEISAPPPEDKEISEMATSAPSIFSSKASTISKEYLKFENNCVSIGTLLKKVNQNSYKSIENILEL